MKNILKPFITVSFVIIIGYVINISSPDVQNYFVKKLGADYWKFFIPILGLYIVWEIYRESGFFKKKNEETDSKNFNLPDTTETRETLKQAKTQVGKSQLGEALNTLSSLINAQVDEKITLLRASLSKLRFENIEGINTYDTDRAENNKLTKRILGLVSEIEAELNETASNLVEIKAYLTKRYTRRLEQKFAGRLPINLKMLPSQEGTSSERAETFITLSGDDINKHIAEIFRKSNGRLLITGLPGGGKTNILLQLELELLKTEPTALPVVLNLATWNKKFNNLNEWLLEISPAELGVSKPYAKTILKQKQLIFLFDGFDEIEENSRVACLDAIGQFGADAKQKFVITSRIEEYKSIANDAPVYAQIQVASLSFEQIETELNNLSKKDPPEPEAKTLLNALKTDPLLREVAEVPFYFNTLQLLFASGKTLSEINFTSKKIKARRNEIVEKFVESELKQIEVAHYEQKKAKHWLSFLAFKMTEFDEVVFELLDLQYRWWRWNKKHFFNAILIEAFARGFLYILVLCFVVSLFTSLLIGLITGLLIGLFVSFDTSLPYIKDISARFSLKLIFRRIMKTSLFDIIFDSIIFGVIFCLVFHLVQGLLLMIVFQLIKIIYDYIHSNAETIIQINKPYQRFTSSMKVLYFSILQHFHLRYLLYKKGLLPFNLATFLNAMSERHFLETDSATWRFRHKILQDYFAKAWVEENKES